MDFRPPEVGADDGGKGLDGTTVSTPTRVDRCNHVWRLLVRIPAGQKCKFDATKSPVERFMETFPTVIAQDR